MLMSLLPGKDDLTPMQREFSSFADGWDSYELRAARGEDMKPLVREDLNEDALSRHGWTEAQVLAAILGWNTAHQFAVAKDRKRDAPVPVTMALLGVSPEAIEKMKAV
jgi:hypothetical protein